MELLGLGAGAVALTLPIIILLLSMCCVCSSSLSGILSIFFGDKIPIVKDQIEYIKENINMIYGSIASSSCLSFVLLIIIITSLAYRKY